MIELSPCPSCARHVSAEAAACPFCGAGVTGARPGPTRLVSRRELTRAAIFAGAALWAGACGPAEIAYDDEDDTAGGDSPDGSGGSGFSRGVDDGSSRGSRLSEEEEEAARRDALAREEEEARRREAEEHRRLFEEQRQLEERYQRRGGCTPEGICPPYGAPPVRDLVV